MKYLSAQMPIERELSADILNEVSDYLNKTFPSGVEKATFGDIHDALLAFRMKADGRRLLINHLAPIYLAVCWREPLV